jgi:hypothetical protein
LPSQCPTGGSRGRKWREYYRFSCYLSKTFTKYGDRHNRARATLLKLPDEILNIIYALVLGGDTIHVFVKEYNKVETRRCQASDADSQAGSTIAAAT